MHAIQASQRHPATRRGRLAGVLATLAFTAVASFALSASPAFAEGCPNGALRAENNSTELPECRAYELVTDPYKEGFAPLGGAFTDDGLFTYESSGNFAENGLAAIFNNYLATRSSTGWLTSSLNPSGPMYAAFNAEAQTQSADLRSSLWLMRLSGESSELVYYYLREPDGSFTRVGPAINPATVPPGAPGAGGPPIQGPFLDGASADLSHVVFDVQGPQAFPGGVHNLQRNLYEYVGTGNERPQMVDLDNAGNQLPGDGSACSPNVSSDGRVVFFVPGCRGSVWARINGTTTIDASASECTRTAGDPGGACNGPAEAQYDGAASDGSRVFFTTTQQLVNGDMNQSNDLYACDIPTGTPAPVGLANPCASLTEVSGAAPDASVENVVRVSPDGSRVYFVATGVLAANTDAIGDPAVSGEHNLYVWQKNAAHPGGQTTFVAKLPSNDIREVQATADGRYLVFVTSSQLLASDTDEVADIYRYDAGTGSLLRLSTDTSGVGGDTPGLEATTPSITADGSTVAFQTAEALSPSDSDGISDVYVWHDGQVSLISKGGAASRGGISPSGRDIYFETALRLTANDGNTDTDIYDARIDGGFSFAGAQPCSGEACQGALAPQPPVSGASASATFNGSGNPAPPETAPAHHKSKPLTRAQKLAKALTACKSKHAKKKRSACEKKARNTYGRGK